MKIKERADIRDVDARIFQLERRMTMDWYEKDQLLKDLYEIRETVYMLSRKHEEINNHLGDYNNKIDTLVDQLI